MTHKRFLIAGFGTLALSTIAVGGIVSAANTETSTTTVTQSRINRPEMKKGNFGQGFGMRGDHGGKGMMFMFGRDENSAIQTAITSNDYNAFITAWNADTNKPADMTVPTADQFVKMVSEHNKRTTIETALQNNDYDAYIKATTPTKEEFTQQVAQHKTQTAIHTAITNKDYTAFVAAWNTDTNKPADATVPTQAEFTKMIDNMTTKIMKVKTAIRK